MLQEKKIAVLGATGAVGQEALTILAEKGVPAANVRAFASARSRGKNISYGQEQLTVEEATQLSIASAEVDYVLGMTDAATAKSFSASIARSGAVFIDNSSAYRLCPEVPLVVPEVNGADALSHRGFISNPNCSTIITLTAVAPIARLSEIREMLVSTYQAVSGAGSGGIAALRAETEAEVYGKQPPPCRQFPYPIAGNLLPQIGEAAEDGYTSEEWKMEREGRKILHTPALRVNCTCVRVPVARSHSISVTLRTKDILPLTVVKEALMKAPGIRYVDDPEKYRYPMPILSTGKDDVYVGRVRRDRLDSHGITLFCCGDQLRRGAAGNAIGIAEWLEKAGA